MLVYSHCNINNIDPFSTKYVTFQKIQAVFLVWWIQNYVRKNLLSHFHNIKTASWVEESDSILILLLFLPLYSCHLVIKHFMEIKIKANINTDSHSKLKSKYSDTVTKIRSLSTQSRKKLGEKEISVVSSLVNM